MPRTALEIRGSVVRISDGPFSERQFHFFCQRHAFCYQCKICTMMIEVSSGQSRSQFYITKSKLCFFGTSAFFSLPAAGLFSCSRLRGTHGARLNTTAQVWGLAEVRGTCSGGSKSQVTTGRHSEHVEPSRPMQTHVQVQRKCPTAHVISRILNVVNVVR